MLTASKSDPMALGVTRTWGCLCGVTTLPCPYHIALLHHRWAIDQCLAHSGSPHDFPLFPTLEADTPDKESVVQSFEHIAAALGEPLYTADGTRRYGGHSPRVAGAQCLAAHGFEVAKLRILALHSSDAIMRYVSDAPLKALRQDLGLPAQDSPLQAIGTIRILKSRLKACEDRMTEQDARISACERPLSSTPSSSSTLAPSPRYIQNLVSMAIHQVRIGSSITTCGWDYAKQLDRGNVVESTSLEAFPWHVLCERCLPALREELRRKSEGDCDPVTD